jgi:endoglucanase
MWNILAARTLGAIRKIEPDRVVVIGPVFYNTAEMLDYLKLPNDPHIVVTVHHYGPPDFYLQGATFVSPVPPIGVSCCDEERKKVLVESFSIAKRWSDKYKYPIFLGEFGSSIYADADSRSAYNRVMRDGAERNGLTWTYWEFASAFGLYDQEAHAFRPKVMEGLLGD